MGVGIADWDDLLSSNRRNHNNIDHLHRAAGGYRGWPPSLPAAEAA